MSEWIRKGVASGICLATALLTSAAWGAPEAGANFGDWQVGCEAQRDGSQKCFVSQRQVATENGQQVISVSVGYLGAKGEPLAVIMLPLGMNLQVGAAFRIDEGKQTPIKIAQCRPEGCQSIHPLDKDTLRLMQNGTVMNFGIIPFGSDRTLTIPVPLNGFAQGLASLR